MDLLSLAKSTSNTFILFLYSFEYSFDILDIHFRFLAHSLLEKEPFFEIYY